MIEKILKKAFDKYYEAPIEAWKYVADQGEQVEYDKKEIIKQADKKENYGYFLLQGAVGSFVWKNDFSSLSQKDCLKVLIMTIG